MTSAPLAYVSIEGFASIDAVKLELSTPVTVLIGANGSGKSNVIRALEILGEIVDRRLRGYVAERGGFDRMLHKSSNPLKSAQTINLVAMSCPDGKGLANGYQARLSAGSDDETVLHERILMHDTTTYPRPYDEILGADRETQMHRLDEPRQQAFADRVIAILSSCRVYHFDDVSPDAPPKRQSLLSDNLELRRDAANLAAYLYRLREEHPQSYRAVLDAVRMVAPFFDDFVLEPQGREHDSVLVRWRQIDSETTFSASQLSDGTLRFICLATLLLSPHRPATIVLDEPELGLHPFAIHQLVELLEAASRDGRRVVLATQSTDLLAEFSLDEVVIVERQDGATQLTRPDAERLSAFLESYSIAELWHMNLLGGRPNPERSATS